jgi:hypothetical protein
MSEERVKLLEELGFVWALRGQEGGRREEFTQQDSETRAVSVESLEPMPNQHVSPQQEPQHRQHPHHFIHQQGHHQNHQAILDEPTVMAAYQEHAQDMHEV